MFQTFRKLKNHIQRTSFRVSGCFSKDDFDFGCLNSRVEHKTHTHDEIPVAEKFRKTPLHFQKQEQEYIEKNLKQHYGKFSVRTR